MPVAVTCPACATSLRVSDQLAGSGKAVRCPKCQGKILLARPAARAMAGPRAKAAPHDPKPTQAAVEAVPGRPPAPSMGRSGTTAAVASTLLRESRWHLRREKSLLFSRFLPIRYEVFVPGKADKPTARLGVIEERCNRVLRALFGVSWVARLFPTKFEVRDWDGAPLLFTVQVPGFRITAARLAGLKEREIQLLDADGRLQCSFVMKIFSLTPSFTVFDAAGKKFAQFSFKMADVNKHAPPRMILLPTDGEEWGTVTGKDLAEAMQLLKEGGKAKVQVQFMPKDPGLIISVNASVADQAMAKKLLLSAAVGMKLFGVDRIFKVG